MGAKDQLIALAEVQGVADSLRNRDLALGCDFRAGIHGVSLLGSNCKGNPLRRWPLRLAPLTPASSPREHPGVLFCSGTRMPLAGAAMSPRGVALRRVGRGPRGRC